MTPTELSRLAIANIEKFPDTWDQKIYHCGTAHCWAGHIDLILSGLDPEKGTFEGLPVNTLKNDVREILGLNFRDWHRATESTNSLDRLKFLHEILFENGDREGRDADGYDFDNYDCKGFNRMGIYNAHHDQKFKP